MILGSWQSAESTFLCAVHTCWSSFYRARFMNICLLSDNCVGWNTCWVHTCASRRNVPINAQVWTLSPQQFRPGLSACCRIFTAVGFSANDKGASGASVDVYLRAFRSCTKHIRVGGGLGEVPLASSPILRVQVASSTSKPWGKRNGTL